MNEEIIEMARIAAQEIYSELIDKFFEHVEKHGKQEAINRCGIPDTTVHWWEKGKRKSHPKLENVLRIIYGLEISAIDIISLLNKHKKLPDMPPGKAASPQKKHTIVK